jgi:hypothetical protein
MKAKRRAPFETSVDYKALYPEESGTLQRGILLWLLLFLATEEMCGP